MKKFTIVFLLLATSCAPWVQIGGLYTSDGGAYSVDLPEGWMKLRQSESLLITRDGVLLQTIAIETLPLSYEFKFTKKKLAKGMLPQETAEVVLDNISSNPDVAGLVMIENSPAQLGGIQGFKAVFTYETKGGLKYRSVYYGAMDGEVFYGIRYVATQRHYFDKDLSTFEKVARSFRFLKKA